MEFADLGAHCQYDLCRQQTYTPFYCSDCHKPYCEFHRTVRQHECIALKKQLLQQTNEYESTEDKKTFDSSNLPEKIRLPCKCERKGCKKRQYELIRCKACNGQYCFNHRNEDDHMCDKTKVIMMQKDKHPLSTLTSHSQNSSNNECSKVESKMEKKKKKSTLPNNVPFITAQ